MLNPATAESVSFCRVIVSIKVTCGMLVVDDSQLTSLFSLSIKGSEGAWPLPHDTMESTSASPPDCASTSEVGSTNCGSSLVGSAIMI